ncbi:MAG: hypothetical protein WAW37_04980 [Syntrophobacteraceae bacterium]
MEAEYIDCKRCDLLPPEVRGYATRTCGLCGALHCDECLNEAGYCTPCSEKLSYSMEEAIVV